MNHLDQLFSEIEKEHQESRKGLEDRYCALARKLAGGKAARRRDVVSLLSEIRKTPAELRRDVLLCKEIEERAQLVAAMRAWSEAQTKATEEARSLREEFEQVKSEYEARLSEIGSRQGVAERHYDRALEAQLQLRREQHVAEEVYTLERRAYDLAGLKDQPSHELRAELEEVQGELRELTEAADAGRLLRRALFPPNAPKAPRTVRAEGCEWSEA